MGGEFNQAQGGLTRRDSPPGGGVRRRRQPIQAWNPSTNRLINGIARDSDAADLFISGRYSRVNVNPNDPFNTGTLRSAVAKVDEAAGAANPNWVAPLQASTDLTTLMVFGSQVYVAGTVRVSPTENWPAASLSTANNNAGLTSTGIPFPPGASSRSRRSGSTVYIGSGANVDKFHSPRSWGRRHDLPIDGDSELRSGARPRPAAAAFGPNRRRPGDRR